jgi:hypothetical protein
VKGDYSKKKQAHYNDVMDYALQPLLRIRELVDHQIKLTHERMSEIMPTPAQRRGVVIEQDRGGGGDLPTVEEWRGYTPQRRPKLPETLAGALRRIEELEREVKDKDEELRAVRADEID